MRWAWKIGSYAGIGVYVHATFLLIILFVVLSYWSQGDSVAEILLGVIFTLGIFLCVVLHEFGHALTAKRYGIKTRDITLLPIGGVARLERMPDEPMQEFWVALAGPAVNVVIAALLFLWLLLTETLVDPTTLGIASGSLLERFMIVNIFLVVFNMIPAFPMDGGRVLRALLATRLEYTRATSIAAGLGQGIALLFGFLGFFFNPFLIFIALFVWIGAHQEASMTLMKASLGGIPVRRAMLTDYRTLAPTDTLGHVIDLILAGFQHDFPVVDDGHVTGILMRNDLMVALAQRGRETPVREVMTTEFTTADPSEMLETAVACLREGRCRTLPVVRGDTLVGMLTMDNVGEFMMIESALRGQPRRPRAFGLREA
jgi:Zn-dependent protease/CBS domain-containing protein